MFEGSFWSQMGDPERPPLRIGGVYSPFGEGKPNKSILNPFGDMGDNTPPPRLDTPFDIPQTTTPVTQLEPPQTLPPNLMAQQVAAQSNTQVSTTAGGGGNRPPPRPPSLNTLTPDEPEPRRGPLQRIGQRVSQGAQGYQSITSDITQKWATNSYIGKVKPQTLGVALASVAALASGSIMYGLATANEKREAALHKEIIQGHWERDKVLGGDMTYGGVSISPGLRQALNESQERDALPKQHTEITHAISSRQPFDLMTPVYGLSGLGVAYGVSQFLTSKTIAKAGFGVGPLGKAGLLLFGLLGGLALQQGVDPIQTGVSNVSDSLFRLVSKDPYPNYSDNTDYVIKGQAAPLMSPDKPYINGVRLTNQSQSPFQSNLGLGSVFAIGGGFAAGVLTLDLLDRLGGSIIKAGYDQSDSLKTTKAGLLASVFESGYKQDRRVSLGKNITPLVIGGFTGGMMGGVEGAVVGASMASFLGGYLLMKEEIGPQLGKRLGSGVIGAFAGLAILSKVFGKEQSYIVGKGAGAVPLDLPERVRRGEAVIPPNIHLHPQAKEILSLQDQASGQAPWLYQQSDITKTDYVEVFNNKRLQPDSEGYIQTKLGAVRFPVAIEAPGYEQQELKQVQDATPLEKTNPIFGAYQAVFGASMVVLAAHQIHKVKPLKYIGPILDNLNSYAAKQLKWASEKAIGESSVDILSGAWRGSNTQILSGLKKLSPNLMTWAIQDVVMDNLRQATVYGAVFIGAFSYLSSLQSQRQGPINSPGSDFNRQVLTSSEDPTQKDIDISRYMVSGTQYYSKDKDVILYDSATVGEGLVNYLSNLPDRSLDAALYELESNPELLKLLQQKAKVGGIRISGGANIHSSPLGNLDNLWYAISKPIRLLFNEGPTSAISSIGSWYGGIVNTLTRGLGLGEAYSIKGYQDSQRIPLGVATNALLYGGVGAIAGSLIGQGSGKGKLIGSLVGATLGALQPTYIDTHYYQSIQTQISMTWEQTANYAKYYAFTDGDSATNKVWGLGLGASFGLTASALAFRSFKGSIAGGIAGAAIGFLAGFGSISRNIYTQGVDIRDKTRPVLHGERYRPGNKELTHIHSKAYVSDTDEYYISTGNIGTLYKNALGDEAQFNISIRGRDKNIARQLRKVMSFLDSVKSGDDLSQIAKESPDLILGGKGSDSTKKIVDHIMSREGNVFVSFPYISDGDGRVVQALIDLERRGQDVYFMASNPRSLLAGGSPESSIKALRKLLEAGVTIYMAPEESDTLPHAKMIATERSLLITSHNASRASDINVFEIGQAIEDEGLGKGSVQAMLRYMLKNGFVDIRSRPNAFPELFRGEGQKRFTGLLNLSPGTESLLAPTQMGSSFFYERALHNNLMRQAGLYDQILTNQDAGVVTALYNMGHMAEHGGLPTNTPWFVKQADIELQTPGLGARLNEFSISWGFGRLYKDEVGFIPSVLGLAGKALDFGWLSTYASPYQEIRGRSEKYQRPQEGFFETQLTNLSNLVLTSASAVSFYLMVSEPLNLLFGQMIKGQAEGALNRALTDESLTKEGWVKVSGVLDRNIAVGNFPALTPEEYRLNLAYNIYEQRSMLNVQMAELDRIGQDLEALDQQIAGKPKIITHMAQEAQLFEETKKVKAEIARLKGQGQGSFFGLQNFKLSLYHLNTLLLRERGAALATNVMEPFLTDVVNPYQVGSEPDIELRKAFRELVQEIGTPAQLEFTEKLTSTEVEGLESYFRYKAIAEGKVQATTAQKAQAISKLTDDLDNVNEILRKAEYRITNVGVERSSNIARALQGVLNHVPLLPVSWGVFQREITGGVASSKNILTMGDLFSFHEASQAINKMLFGHQGLEFLVEKYSNVHRQLVTDRPTPQTFSDKVINIWQVATRGTLDVIRDLGEGYALHRKLAPVHDAFSRMEEALTKTGQIFISGESVEAKASALSKAVTQLASEGIPSTDPRYTPRLVELQAETLRSKYDFTLREVGDISDEGFHKALDAAHQFRATLTPNEDQLFSAKYLNYTHDHAEGMGLNTLESSKKKVDRLLSRLAPGMGGDATSSITKSKYGTLTVTVLAASLFINQAFTSTEGVSLLTSIGTALQMGADNRYANTKFGSDRLFGDILGAPGDLVVSAGVILPFSIMAAKATEGARVDKYGFSIQDAKLTHKYTPNELSSLPISTRGLDDALSPDAGGFTKGVRRVSEGLYDVLLPSPSGHRVAYGMALEGEYFVTRVAGRVGNTWRKVFSNWAIGSLGLMGFTKLAAWGLETSRSITASIHTEGQGTLDPIIGGIGGAALGLLTGKAMGRRAFTGFMLGAGIGGIGGLFTQFTKVGRPGPTADAMNATMVANLKLYSEAVKERALEGKASKLELMAAFYAEGMAGMSNVVKDQSVSKETRVIAKQVTAPFLQFFLSETSKGITYDSSGQVRGQGVKYYSFGIQLPTATGVSTVFQMPFKLKSSGTGLLGLGLAENDQFDIGDLYSQASGVAALLYGTTFALQGVAYGATRATNRFTSGVPFKTGVLPGIAKATDVSITALSQVGALGLKLGVNLTVGDTSLIVQGVKRSRVVGTGVRALAWATLFSQIGGAIGGALTTPDETGQVSQEKTLQNIYIGQLVGVGAGVTIAGFSNQFLTKAGGALKASESVIDKIPNRYLRFGFAALASMGYALLQTDSNYGTTFGMDDDFSQRLVTIGLTGAAGGFLYGNVAGIGRSIGDTFDEYISLRQQASSITGQDIVSVTRRSLLERRVASLEKEVNTALDVSKHLVNKVDGLGSNRLKAIVQTVKGFDPGVRAADLTPEMVKDITKYGQGLGVRVGYITSAISTRRLIRAGMVSAIAYGIGTTLANAFPTTTNNLYEAMDSVDTPIAKQLMGGLADTLRLFTGTDYRVNNDLPIMKVYRGDDLPKVMQYRKLRSANEDPASQMAWRDISRLLVVDDPNVFISLFNITGFSFSPGEEGIRGRQYFQVQGPGADVSTAAYGMATTFLWQEALGGNREMQMLITSSMRELNESIAQRRPLNQGTLRRVGRKILLASERLQPVLKGRKFTRPSNEELEAASKDSLLMDILESKDKYIQSLTYAPPASIVSKLIKAGVQAHSESLSDNLMRFLLKGDQAALQGMYSDAFGLSGRDLHITGLVIPSMMGKGKGSKVETSGEMSHWIEDASFVPVEAKQKDSLLNPIQALSSIIPGPIGYAFSIIGGAALTLFALASLGNFATAKAESTLEAKVKEYYEGSSKKGWFMGGDDSPAFKFRFMSDAHGNRLIRVGEEITTLYKGNYFLGVSTKVLKDHISNLPGVGAAQWEGFFTSFAQLQGELDNALRGDYLTDPSKYMGAAPGKGTIYERMTDRGYIKGIADRALTWKSTSGKNAGAAMLTMIDGKQVILDRAGFITRLEDELSKPINEVLESFFLQLEKADLGSGQSGAFLRLATGDQSVNTLEDLSRWAQLQGRPMLGSQTGTIIDVFQRDVRGVISTVLEREILDTGFAIKLERALQYGGGELNEVIRFLSIKVQAELMDAKGPLHMVRHSFGGILQPVELPVLDRIQTSIGEAIRGGRTSLTLSTPSPKKAKGPSIISGTSAPQAADLAEEVGKTRLAGGSLADTGKAVWKGAGALFQVAGYAFDVIEGVDIFGSFSRAAESFADESFTSGERVRLTNEAGGTASRSIFSALVIGGLFKLVPLVASKAIPMAVGAITSGLTALGVTVSLPALALVAIGAAILTGVGLGVDHFFNQGKGREAIWGGLVNVGKSIWSGASTLAGWLGSGLDMAGDAIGGGLRFIGDVPKVFGDNVITRRASSGAILGIGGLLGGAVVGLGLLAGGAIALPAAGMVALGGMLAGALLGTAAPSLVESIFSTITNFLGRSTKDTPLGEGVLATLPGQWIHQRFKNVPGSPFYMGTAQEAVEHEWKKSLDAFKDYTGKATGALLIDYNLTNNGAQISRAVNEFGYSIKPGVVIDPYLQAEIAIRGQYYNQTVIGQGLWKAMYKDAINKSELKPYITAEEEAAKVALAEALAKGREKRLAQSRPAPRKGNGVDMAALYSLAAPLAELHKGIIEQKVKAKVKVKAPPNIALNMNTSGDHQKQYTPTENKVEVHGNIVVTKRIVRADAEIWQGQHNTALHMNPCATPLD